MPSRSLDEIDKREIQRWFEAKLGSQYFKSWYTSALEQDISDRVGTAGEEAMDLNWLKS